MDRSGSGYKPVGAVRCFEDEMAQYTVPELDDNLRLSRLGRVEARRER